MATISKRLASMLLAMDEVTAACQGATLCPEVMQVQSDLLCLADSIKKTQSILHIATFVHARRDHTAARWLRARNAYAVCQPACRGSCFICHL